MTEETKEMLKEMQEYASGGMTGLYFPENMVQDLLDYITNLQQLYENALKVNQNTEKYRTELETKYVILQQENKRLNNIINEYEKWLNELGAWCYVEKLKELKESGNNE